ncbi:transcription factor GTE4-like isoform X2 [Oryza brachyantha]|nr:transcription factor GTE4-like isoform X2 [Oryza brachyantha]XP_040376480.1 transcription factor GTE4-like isoform X2 [Oryza brachyantha]XP_040376481.1 transcription factor GTE4-like isoform X2 [Oryza brachyantha]
MASSPPGGSAGGEEPAASPAPLAAAEEAPEEPVTSRWAPEIRVYRRKHPRKNPKPPPNPSPNSSPLAQTLASIRRSIRRPEDASRPDPAAPESSSPRPRAPAPAAAASDGVSAGPNRDGGAVPNGHGDGRAAAEEKARKRRARSELRRQLASELDQVRGLSKRLKAAAEAMAAESAVALALPVVVPPPQLPAGYAHSQFTLADPVTPIPSQVAVAPVRSVLQRGPLTVSVTHTESFEKEKRTPKANQLYQNSEFLLAKDKFPPADSHGRKKPKHHKKKHRSFASHGAGYDAEQRLYSHAFKKSLSLLSRLMKHKFGWVFNKPVDAVALGLHDYFAIIKHPMDLGTIKTRLTHGQYRNPREFADDVRLTFHNAMTYNPKGQDVHFMAEQLAGIFEAQWPEIEAEVQYLASCPPLPNKFPPPPIDVRFLERSDSVKHHMALDSKSRPMSHTPTYSARTPSMKKPKAKDPDKRDMTIDEKRKLSNNLQNLPPEKLDVVVQIIKNKNLSVRQHDDEIEVEIDSMDTETLWELDRFVANYKKNLSKQKRKAERAMLARQDAELRAQHVAPQQPSQEPNIGVKSPKQNLTADEQLATSVPEQNDNNGQNASRSSSSSSSSSDSGSSSSDSDSDSSSSDGSDAANSS